MSEDPKVSETPKVSDAEPFLENRRQVIEKQVILENETFPEPELIPEETPLKEEPKKEEAKIDEKVSDDPVERIKQSTQKRINKAIAKQKTAEDKLAEAEAELARLKSAPKQPDPIEKKDDGKPPTLEQVKAYIVQMRQEGKIDEEIAALDYLVELKKSQAVKEVEERQTKSQSEAQRQNQDMKILANDYVVLNEKGEPDIKNDMTLANQQGLLFKLSLDYFNDPARHKDRYDNSNVVEGFRRAVADAYRDIQEHYRDSKKTPKEDLVIEPRRNPRLALAEPEAEAGDDTPSQSNSNLLSDAEKARAEINFRNKNRYVRRVPQG